MPRLSLYRPEKSNDYKFIDRQCSEMFQVGGTDVYLHKYMGPKLNANGTNDQPTIDSFNVTNIQDLLFLENRDRKYEEEIYKIRGLYNVQNIDFNLSQFGLFIDNDTLYMTVHINDFIKYIGRKPISGDVIELPHLRDDFALNEYDISLPRYYVIEDVGRASEGFSVTWFPHLYRLKLKKITDSQQFADILDKPATNADGMPGDRTLRELLSTHSKELEINDAILQQAEADASKSGYETGQFYTLAVDKQGKPILNTTPGGDITNARPVRTGYTGYLVGDGFPSNGYDFGHGIQFPEMPADSDFFLRTDFLPNRLYRFDNTRWVKVEDAVRMTMTNNDTRATLKTGFINNSNYIYNEAVAQDWLKLPPTVSPVPENYNYVFDTAIDYQTLPLYIVFKLDTVELAYTVIDNEGIITNNAGKITITLPIVNEIQQRLPYDGVWKLSLCNNREAQRQSLSKVLRPKADL